MKTTSDKCVSCGSSSNDSMTPEEFRNHPKATTWLGKLFLELVDDDGWPDNISIWAHFDIKNEGRDFVCFYDRHLQDHNGTRALSIKETDPEVTVSGATKLIFQAYKEHAQALWTVQASIEDIRHNVNGAKEAILFSVAKKYILQKFPELPLEQFESGSSQRYVFFMDKSTRVVYVMSLHELEHKEFDQLVVKVENIIDIDAHDWFLQRDQILRKIHEEKS